MRLFSAVFTLAIGITLTAGFSASVQANNLYQWTTSDGTPTYSPDPPPAGVDYQIVGPDLKPLPKQIDFTQPPTAAAAKTPKSTVKSPVVPSTQQQPTAKTVPQPSKQATTGTAATEPATTKPAKPWKPVRYADNPNAPAKKPAKAPAQLSEDPVSIARNSPECVSAKQEMLLLEGRFAQAQTDQEMDQAVLLLRDHKSTLQAACKLN